MNFSQVSPRGFKAVYGVENYVQSVLDQTLLHLIKVRASMLNGCAYCLNMHTTDALKEDETSQRLFGLAAWRESSFYDERERAALALTDAVTILERTGVPDEAWDGVVEHFGEEGAANVLLAIGTINLWTRLNVATRRQPDLAG
ncbi:carboxymuconolactone decarboxylase family protein [Kribbella solani]|uniref:carboxymuconolactone decarboxylase family protein n=1 Tax=Kribbella solani TaxID=236067 RepID=UPI0029A4FA74|nr:carboxymuconolactone decarboxylase family protein [Kribbella solani]MDX2971037.1 carboxymuconolactone decarboxylase family protein [Kribbella solani]MDX3004662.1 carboxymuconolactone decarboxylase family protein [Kribbella solani]